jgi:hypothetical protein
MTAFWDIAPYSVLEGAFCLCHRAVLKLPVPLKLWSTLTRLHSAISKKAVCCLHTRRCENLISQPFGFFIAFNITCSFVPSLLHYANCILIRLSQVVSGVSFVELHIYIHTYIITYIAVPWLRWLVTGLSPRRPGFVPGSVRVGFVVDKVAQG